MVQSHLRRAGLWGLLLASFIWGHSQRLSCPPMQGHTTANSITVWLMAEGTQEVRVQLGGESQTMRLAGRTAWDDHVPMTFTFDGLNADQAYPLSVALDGQAWPEAYALRTFKAEAGGAYSFMLGSCALYGTGAFRLVRPGTFTHIFESMLATPSDFFIWMGDNVYLLSGEWDDSSRTYEKYTKVRLEPRGNAFMTSRPQYAIRDDHDFGPDNSGSEFVNKGITTAAFHDFWPNPPAVLPGVAGTFTQFSYRDSDFFLLDGRHYRMAADSSQMYGKAQMQWLCKALEASKATFKFIATGSQSLSEVNPGETWADYAEREAFIDFLREARIPGVVFLSGDRHFTEMMRYQPTGMYPLYEVTCSPLTSILRRKPLHKNDVEYNNPLRLDGTKLVDHNYGRLSIDGPMEDRVCTVEIFDAAGHVVWTRQIHSAELHW
jgi:alkaline phosphatase D